MTLTKTDREEAAILKSEIEDNRKQRASILKEMEEDRQYLRRLERDSAILHSRLAMLEGAS